MLNKIERVLGRYAIPHLALYLVIGQVGVYLLSKVGSLNLNQIALYPMLVKQGEYWRLLSFFFMPPMSNPVCMAFGWYLFYLMGTSLEHYWGVLRFNIFILIGTVLTVGLGFTTPYDPVLNTFVVGSVFLAFAYLNPDFELAIFFILPVRIKWLALVTWIGYAVGVLFGDWSVRWQILAATGNFLLFFGHDIVLTMKMRRRRMTVQADRFGRSAADNGPRHRCHVCNKNSDTHPELDFRYCSKCEGDQCYCPEHISAHSHVLETGGSRQ
ncbi:MAG TPA: hypothetical protein VIM44_04605 [Rariglobus sp.]